MTGRSLNSGLGADAMQDFDAVEFGEHEVEDDDIGWKGLNGVPAGLAVAGELDLESFGWHLCR
jgi:hypothetical protein